MEKKTLLVIVPGSDTDDDAVFHLFIAETGECLASNLCSSASFAKGDLYERRPERVNEYTERFGKIELKFIDETDLTEEEMIARNHTWFESISKKEKS